MNTDYNLYKIFLYLYEEKSISKTANKLYVSQPAISYSLKELETQLGYTLFYRNSKGIEPTTEANELYSYISTAFNILKDAEDHIKNLKELKLGCIRIGTSSAIGSSYLSHYISEFRKQYPGIRFEISCKSSSEMIELLEKKKIDIVIDSISIPNKKEITKTTLTKLNYCFTYNKQLMKEVSIKQLEDLKNVPLILPNKTSLSRIKLEEEWEEKHMKLEPIVESNDTEFLLEMVRQGNGVGYLLEKEIDSQPDKESFEKIEFHKESFNMDINCFYLKDFITSASSKFIEFILQDKKKNIN